MEEEGLAMAIERLLHEDITIRSKRLGQRAGRGGQTMDHSGMKPVRLLDALGGVRRLVTRLTGWAKDTSSVPTGLPELVHTVYPEVKTVGGEYCSGSSMQDIL